MKSSNNNTPEQKQELRASFRMSTRQGDEWKNSDIPETILQLGQGDLSRLNELVTSQGSRFTLWLSSPDLAQVERYAHHVAEQQGMVVGEAYEPNDKSDEYSIPLYFRKKLSPLALSYLPDFPV